MLVKFKGVISALLSVVIAAQGVIFNHSLDRNYFSSLSSVTNNNDNVGYQTQGIPSEIPSPVDVTTGGAIAQIQDNLELDGETQQSAHTSIRGEENSELDANSEKSENGQAQKYEDLEPPTKPENLRANQGLCHICSCRPSGIF
jgi:hypothetical protein